MWKQGDQSEDYGSGPDKSQWWLGKKWQWWTGEKQSDGAYILSTSQEDLQMDFISYLI